MEAEKGNFAQFCNLHSASREHYRPALTMWDAGCGAPQSASRKHCCNGSIHVRTILVYVLTMRDVGCGAPHPTNIAVMVVHTIIILVYMLTMWDAGLRIPHD